MQFWEGSICVLDSLKHLIKGKVKEEQKKLLTVDKYPFLSSIPVGLPTVCPD